MRETCTLPKVIITFIAPLSPPRRDLCGGGTRELVGAVRAIELAVAHEVRLDALGHALQTSGNNEALFKGQRHFKDST